MLDREPPVRDVPPHVAEVNPGPTLGPPHGSLRDRVAVVSGGTGNVGRFLVSALLHAGARVIVPSRSEAKLKDLLGGYSRLPAHRDQKHRLRGLVGNITDETEGPAIVKRILREEGRLDAAVASLGRFVPTRNVLSASRSELEAAVEGYLMAHFGAAKAILPVLRVDGGSYTFIQGPLAFEVWSKEASLVSVASSAQAMLARALMEEESQDPPPDRSRVRVNEVVMYAPVGWDDHDGGPLKPEHIGAFVARLMSDEAKGVHGRSIHLKSPGQVHAPWSEV